MNTNNNTVEIPEMITAKDVAALLNIGYTKALELLKYGQIPSIKLGSTYRTTREAVAEWLHSNLKK